MGVALFLGIPSLPLPWCPGNSLLIQSVLLGPLEPHFSQLQNELCKAKGRAQATVKVLCGPDTVIAQ